MPFYKLNVTFPVAFAMNTSASSWAGVIISFGAIAGLTTVLLVMMYGQTRVFYAMSRDGLIPPLFVRLHPTWRTPWLSQILFGVLIAAAGAFFPISILGSLTNMGTLVGVRARLGRRADAAQPPSRDAREVQAPVRSVHHSRGCRRLRALLLIYFLKSRQPARVGLLPDRMAGFLDLVHRRTGLLFLLRPP